MFLLYNGIKANCLTNKNNYIFYDYDYNSLSLDKVTIPCKQILILKKKKIVIVSQLKKLSKESLNASLSSMMVHS